MKTKKRIIVGSTPFVPPIDEGTKLSIVVEGMSLDDVRAIIDDADEVVSFCGHEDSASYLGVVMNREAALIGEGYYYPGTVWVGIRPIKRPMPGEEVEVRVEGFVGWKMTIIS